MTYFTNIVNTIYNIATNDSFVSLIKNYADVLLKILTGVIAIKGLGYLKPLKEKTIAATFNFWAQLRTRLTTISNWLKSNSGFLNNMYSNEAKGSWENLLTPSESKIKEFKTIVEETIQYAKSANDQMPAYIGWSDDYNKVLEYLNDMIIYDISNSKYGFKFNTPVSKQDAESYIDSICAVIDKVCMSINKRQKVIELEILRNFEKKQRRTKRYRE